MPTYTKEMLVKDKQFTTISHIYLDTDKQKWTYKIQFKVDKHIWKEIGNKYYDTEDKAKKWAEGWIEHWMDIAYEVEMGNGDCYCDALDDYEPDKVL